MRLALKALVIMTSAGFLSSCSGDAGHKMNVAAPMPPATISTSSTPDYNQIQPANGVGYRANAAPEKQACGFSSFQRKHTVGYEIDQSRHISFKVSPSFDIWNPTDFETKVSLRFTKALGGSANKRPDCVYGSGYYGLLPYATNEGVNLRGVFEGEKIKSFVEEKLDERERRRQERADNPQSI